MRRGRLLLILIVVLMAAGLSCLATSNAQFNARAWGGAALLLVAATAGMMNAISNQRDMARLAEQISKRANDHSFGRIQSPSRDSLYLSDAINELFTVAEKTVSDAAIKVKELEIELKVATAERQHAEAIIYSISDAVLVTDPFDDVVLANESAARAFEFDLAKAERSPVEMVLKDQKVIDLIREMRQSNSAQGRRVVEHTVKSPTCDPKTYKITLSCVADKSDQHPAGVVAVLHDMTKETEVAKMKNDFVSNVSHELRTPLASIKAYVEMLIDGEADDEKTKGEFYEVIQNEANRLSRLIDNILNISRIESGLVKINKQPQSLTVITKEAIEVIAPQAKGKQINIAEQLTPVFYQTIADRDMLYQAILNLLSNSVKYTPEGGTITVYTEVDEAKKKVIARISDTGVGIPPKDIPFVFDKFYRVEANNRMAKGTGLGLSLVKHIVETVHGGRVFLESTQGKGSTFGFELDLAE